MIHGKALHTGSISNAKDTDYLDYGLGLNGYGGAQEWGTGKKIQAKITFPNAIN